MKSVYVMESNGHFKVGVSDNPRKRLKSLSIGNCDISLIYESQKLSNAYCVEGYLHKTFSGFGVGGEWFKIEDKSEVLGEVKKAVATLGKTQLPSAKGGETKAELLMRTEDGQTLTFSEWLKKTKEETKQIAWENVELQNFLLTMLGFDMPNVYTNCIYKVLFGMNAKQLREKYGVGAKGELRDCFTVEELSAIQPMECLVSGLVDCGWEYAAVKSFIEQNHSKRLAA